MHKAADFTSLYVDLDSFFASAEQHFDPALRGRPVGVIPLETRHTVLIAASREAKTLGLATGTPVAEAVQRCPNIALVVARHDLYVRLHRDIIRVVDDILPVRKVCSIDEVTCRLLANERDRATEIAHAIKQAIASRIGPALTCSIGLAPNELLAKLAAEMRKPDGLVALRQADLSHLLLDLELTAIPGISHGNAARLAKAGVTSMAALWALAPAQVRAIWGGVQGERFWAFLHGFDIERAPTQRRMFGHGRVLAWDWRGPVRTEACARLLLMKAMRRMRREDFSALIVTLGLMSETGRSWAADERHFLPFRDDHTALLRLERLFARARAAAALGRTKHVQVTVHGLVENGAIQHDLLEASDDRRRRLRWERLADLTDKLQGRYQRAILTLGPNIELPGSYAGAKIAFGRIPDLLDF